MEAKDVGGFEVGNKIILPNGNGVIPREEEELPRKRHKNPYNAIMERFERRKRLRA